MAITFTQLAAIKNDNGNANSYAGNAGTPSAGDLLICFVAATATTVAGGATFAMTGTWTWQLLTYPGFPGYFTFNGGADTVCVFWAYASAGTSTTPTFTCAGDNATGCIQYCVRISGADGQTQPYIRSLATNTGSTQNPSVTHAQAVATGNGILGFATNGTSSATQWGAPTGWNEGGEVATTLPNGSGEGCWRTSGETGTTIAWTNANTTAWAVIQIEFYVAGAGATPLDGATGASGVIANV